MNVDITIDDVRVRGVGKSFDSLGPSVFTEASCLSFVPVTRAPEPSTSGEKRSKCAEMASVYYESHGRLSVPVYLLERLVAGDLVEGPGKLSLALSGEGRSTDAVMVSGSAMVIDGTQTIVVDPKAKAKITSKHVLIELAK
jgi:5-oxoprolinase (ATP-hydrolysing)